MVEEDDLVATKMTVGEEAINFKGMVLTTYAAQAGEVTVTEEGAAIKVAKVTESG